MQNSNQDEIMEIDWQDLFGLLLHRIWIICLAAIVTGVAGFMVSFFLITPQYESTTSIYISTNKQNEKTMTYSDAQLATQLTKDYEELIVGRYVLERVIKLYELDENYESLKNRVQVTNTSDTRIINITVKDPNPQNAQIIANSIRDIASEHIKTVTDVEAVNVADEANLPNEPAEPSVPKWTLLGAFIGAALALGAIVLRYLLDDTIKSAEDVEKYLELSTLALIPDFDAAGDKSKKNFFGDKRQVKKEHRPRELEYISKQTEQETKADEATTIEVLDMEKEQK